MEIGFREIMFVYSLENAINPTDLLVTVPDVFVDMDTYSAESEKKTKGNMGIIRNSTLPAFSNYYVTKNYISLPVIKYFGGSSDVVGPNIKADGSVLRISSSDKTNYPMDVGIGKVNVGDRLVAVFVNGDPKHGIIIARC